MFRKPKKNTKGKFRSRKRTVEDDDDDNQTKRVRGVEDEENETSTSHLLQQIKNEKNGKKRGSKFSNTGDDNDQMDGSKKSLLQQYASTEKPSDKDMATRTAQHHPEERVDKNVKFNTNGENSTEDNLRETDKKLYKGTKETRNKFLAGPLKAPTFVRTTSRFDYQPDICKDYKDTGFCGFGDTCIYLHDRGNTMSGWQLEEEYERKKKEQQDAKEREMDLFCQVINGGGSKSAEKKGASGNVEMTADGLPFACYLCREAFKDPVVTSCNHYFCQDCIMQHVKNNSVHGNNASTSSACPICQKDTHGVFNYANKLYQKRRRLDCETWEDFAAKSSGR
jgi:RING finger protein 113A